MTNIGRIVGRKLATLGFAPATRNGLVVLVMRHKNPDLRVPDFECDRQRRSYMEERAAEITVKDIMDVRDARAECYLRELPTALRHFQKKLQSFGMTILDWVALPRKTAKPDMLRRLGRKRLLQKSVLVLPTLSWHVLDALRSQLGRSAAGITVEEFLGTTWSAPDAIRDEFWWSISRRRYNFDRSVSNTRKFLRDLGFTYKDGAFMQEGTHRLLVEHLREEHGLKRGMAIIVADIAAKRGWIAPFRDDSN